MKHIVLTLIYIIVPLFSFSQNSIKGRVTDYYTNESVPYAILSIDSSIASGSFHIKQLQIDSSGRFSVDSLKMCGLINLTFHAVGYEQFKIINIPITYNSKIILDSINLFPGSYYWDGTVTKKYFLGLFRKTKGCGGYVKGFSEQNVGIDSLKLPYPNKGNQRTIKIIKNSVVIDYKEIK
jgi:hypothetical protein